MIAVIFEVIPQQGNKDEYLHIAKKLRPLLDTIDGFISIERFQSLSDDSKLLSLSFWKNEESIRQWRNMEEHRMAQIAGRDHVFNDYRLRIAAVIRDYGMFERNEAPADSREVHSR
jgi:heme-degrading monooxygenase HmoA